MDVFQLASNRIWKAAPGCRVLIIDHGGVRLDIPDDWVVYAPNRHVFVIDRFPPNNRVLMTISCMRMTPDVAAISPQGVVDQWIKSERRAVVENDAVCFRRLHMEAAWLQMRVNDWETGRDKCTRLCVAHADLTQAIIVFEFDAEEEARFDPAWTTLMDTLVVGDYITDPTMGSRRMMRG